MDRKNFFLRLNKIGFSIFLGVNMLIGPVGAEQVKPSFVPEVKALADKTKINIGDILHYAVTIQAPVQAQLRFSADQDNKTVGPFEIKSVKESKISPDRGGQKSIRDYELTVFKVGEQDIPEYVVEYRLSDKADWRKITAPAIKISVESVLEKEAKDLSPKPLKPRIIIWRDFWGWVISLIIMALIGISVFLIKKYLIKLKAQPEIIIPAHVIALEELKRLQEQNLIAQGKIELYFELLSGCIRHYLENRFHLRAPWLSTEEFLSKAKTSPVLTTEQKHLLQDFLILCDMVKFARYESSAREAQDSFNIVRNFVEQTKQPEKDNDQEVKK